MIQSFKDKGLKAFFEEGVARKLAVKNTDRVALILAALDAATAPSQMNIPGWRWHNLAPKWPSRYTVWVSGNYRITFAFKDGHAVDVDLEDYH